MADATLFHGIAVIIDDEITTEPKIRDIEKQIKDVGCHVIEMTAIPDAAALANFGGASFFIVDWNLRGKEMGELAGGEAVVVPTDLQQAQTAEVIGLLKDLRDVRFAPVFVFTNEAVDTIKNELREAELYDESDPSHILVVSKAEILEKGVFPVLAEWLQQAPSAYVLKRWESEYNKAKNALFRDFYAKSVHWPLIMKKTFEEDDVSPSVELGNLIGRNLLSRMTPYKFDLDSFDESPLKSLENDRENYKHVLMKVLEGERFLRNSQLDADSIGTGDIFKDGADYFVNIRPECDCIPRGGKSLDDVELYLLRGLKLGSAQLKEAYEPRYGLLRDRDTESIIFSIHEGITVSFKFKTLWIKKWSEYKDKRIGRLLPPFMTRLQQRFSAYLQRPGLTRVPPEALYEAAQASGAAPQDASGGTSANPSEPQTISTCLSTLWAVTKETVRRKLRWRQNSKKE